MSSIDKRILEMEFINDDFERDANKSMSTLDKLVDKLKLKDGLSGLSDLGNKSKDLNFEHAEKSAGLLQTKLSALGVIGVTALANITNSAVNAGKRMTNALTIEPIKMGFSEYETKIGAIQTILTNTASKGTKLKDVTKALNELNSYADKTIYNFSEMTKNIGTFTAAGVDLDTAVSSIKGIANLAAGSGSTPQQAATAMYQLSQAIAAGRVSLQDWNSVVNAGMGGELLQKELKATAKGMGIVVDESKPFRESLQDGWLTADVLTKTLNKFSKDKSLVEAATKVKTFSGLLDTMKESVQSGWAVSWEHIIGDFDQAPELLTNIANAFNDLIQPSTDARNNMLEFWNEAGGRDDVIAGFTNIFQSLGKGLKAASEGFREMVPAMTGEKLVDLSKKFKDLTEKFKMSDQMFNNIKSVFKALGSVVQVAGKAFQLFGTILKPITSNLDNIFNVIANGIGGFAKLISKINDAILKMKLFESIGKFISQLFSNFGKIGQFVGELFDNIKSGVGSLNMGDTFKPVIDAFGRVADGFKNIITNLGSMIGDLDINNLLKVINTLLIGKGMKNLKDFVDSIGESAESVTDLGGSISSMIGSVTDTFEALQNRLNAGTLMKIAGAISILSLALVVLSSIDEAGMDNAIVGIMTIATTLTLSLLSLLKVINGKNLGSLFFLSGAVKGIAFAMVLLASAMKIMSTISWDGIAKGLISITTLTVALTASMKILSGNKTSLGLPMAFIGIATSILILSKAVEQLAKIDSDGIAGGLLAVGLLMTELTVFMKVMQGVKMSPSSIVGIITISGALNLMALAVKQLSAINPNELTSGLSGLAVILAEIAVFTRLVGNGSGLIQTSVGVTIIAGAMMILTESIKALGSLNPETLTKGLIGLGGALVAVGLGTKVIPKDLIGKSIGLNILAIAMINISKVLDDMGGNDWGTIARGLVAIGGSLLVLAGGLRLMSGTLMGSAALTVAAGALALLTVQFKTLSGLNLSQIGMGLLAMAGIFAVLGGAGLLLSPLIPAILGLAGAMLALSGSAAIMAGSLVLTGVGLTIIAGAGLMVVEGLRQLTGVLPKFVESIFNSVKQIGPGLAESIKSIGDSMGQIVLGLVEAFKNIVLYIPEIVKVGVDIVIGLVTGIMSQADRLAEAAVKLITALTEGITKHLVPLSEAAIELIVTFVNVIASNLSKVIQAGIDLALSLVEGIADGLMNNKDRATAAIEKLITAVIEVGASIILGGAGAFLLSGGKLMQGLIDGIKDAKSKAKQSVKDVVEKAKEGASNLGDKLKEAGKQLIAGFSGGIKGAAKSAIKAVTGVVNGAINRAKALLGIHSPSRVFMGIGDYTVQGFSKGIDKNARRVDHSMTKLANNTINGFKRSISDINSGIGEIASPVITPVLDLSDVESGGKHINGLLGGMTSIGSGLTSSIGASIRLGQNDTNGKILSAIKSLGDSLGRPNTINKYSIEGITYDDGTAMSNTISDLIRIAKVERRR